MNKHAKTSGIVWLIAILGVAIMGILVYAVFFMNVSQTEVPANTQTTSTGTTVPTCGQNPSLSYAFTNALTHQSITASATNVKDTISGNLLGSNPTLGAEQVVSIIANASGYIPEIQPDYKVLCGNQQVTGDLYQYANATISIYNDAGTEKIGGTNGSTANDTASGSTSQHNNKIVITGNVYKSTGRQFIIYEVANVTSVQSVALSESGSSSPISSVAVPACYTNQLVGTPYRIAWEIPAIVGGTQKTYNLQTVSLNGNSFGGGAAFLTMYTEKDYYDTLTGAYLTSGICDTNNAAYWFDKQANSWFINA